MKTNLQRLHPFCLASPDFFDTPDRIADTADRFPAADRPAPDGWLRAEHGFWVSLRPEDAALPKQGWKIHVSVTLPGALKAVDSVWQYCVDRRLPFKFLRSGTLAHYTNSKYADRAGSGKLITVYPADEETLGRVLPEISDVLSEFDGAYILSDLRYGDAPVFVRYGAFLHRTVPDEDGDPVYAVESPDGTLVRDDRSPAFRLPPWVSLPEFLVPHFERRQADTRGDFPFDVLNALHYSNAGGVYRARDQRTGEVVVLREARPHAGLDRDGVDAVARLRREHAVLRRLQGLDCVPGLLDYRRAWEHHFLVEEHVEGETLADGMARRRSTMHRTPTAEANAEYTAWVLGVLARLEQALAQVHSRGVRYGDLHPGNVIVRPDGRVVLVDFELATELDDPGSPALGAPGFTAPPGVHGAAADLYLLDCIRLWLFVPVNLRADREPRRLAALVSAVEEHFPVPPGFGARLLRGLRPSEPPAEPDTAVALLTREPLDWPAIRDSLVGGILASASPDRDDRLYPGDPEQFATGGLSLAYGAAGVLHALHRVGAEVPDEHVDWLVRNTLRATEPRAGLYTGLHGVAWVLHTVGRTDEALETIDRVASAEERSTGVGLLSGKAGIGLSLLHLAHLTGDGALRARAQRAADELAAFLRENPDSPLRPPRRAGLLEGMSGVAQLFLSLYEDCGDTTYLELARTALDRDLACGEHLSDGTFQLRESGRYLVYLESGSGGLALALERYLRHRPDPESPGVVEAVRRGCEALVVRQPGLFRGRAGLIATLRQLGAGVGDPAVLVQTRRLAWHAQTFRGHLAFPGVQLLRLSMDLATGSAGILLALNSAFEHGGSALPLLDPRPPAPASTERR